MILLLMCSSWAHAQTKILFTQTGSPERIIRVLGDYLNKNNNQNINVELAAGGGIAIGVNRFKENQNNLLFVNDAFFIGVIEGLYNINHFSPISFIGETPLVIAVKSNSNIGCYELKNNALFYGVGTKGSAGHYSGILFKQLNPKITIVEYKVASNFIIDLLGERIETITLHPGSLNENIKGLVNTGGTDWYGIPSWKECFKTNRTLNVNYFLFGHPSKNHYELNKQINMFLASEESHSLFRREKYKNTKMDIEATEAHMNKVLNNWKLIVNVKE